MPIIEGYWLYPSITASAAARRMSSGPGPSGNPWPRLMALLSRAACDIASKTVTGRSANTLFMEVMEMSAAGPGRQSRRLPGQHAARKVLVIGKARGLGGKRGRHRSLARAAGKHHLLALRIGNILRVESGERDDDRARIGLHRNLVWLTDVDQKITPLGHALRDVFRRQIVHLIALIRHAISPKNLFQGVRSAPAIRGPKSPLARRKSSTAKGLKHCRNPGQLVHCSLT